KQPGRFAPMAALAAGIAAAGMAAPAPAQVAATADCLARLDAAGDGRVPLSEYRDCVGYAFRELDLPGDGVLASHELPGGRGAPVTLAQHRARLAERFAKQDANGDGVLDARELAAPPRR